ncbi:ankyrin repeat domain-containing protein [bacterium]|nr:ankyrin repeat domain-containing protein [bacterium]
MKHILITTIAAVVLVGCGESQQESPPVEANPVEPVAEVPSQPSPPAVEAKPVKPVVEATKPKPPTTTAPAISIHEAVGTGNLEAVKQHLAAGTDVDARDRHDKTTLHNAAWIGHKEIAELLIAEGADLNAKNNDGWTPLSSAAANGHKEVVELLIVTGANVNVKFDDGVFKGETPLDIAIADKHPETADLLRKHGGKMGKELGSAKPDISIHDAAEEGNIEAAKQHLAAGTNVNAKRYGTTPLYWATLHGHKEIVELLIAEGADVNAKNANDITPLDYAKDRPEIAALLRKHGGKTGAELKAEGK